MTDYKLMPKQITKEMADAFWEEYSKDRADDLLMRCYRALYVTAPSPHPDDASVDRFAKRKPTMKTDDPASFDEIVDTCAEKILKQLLRGNMRDGVVEAVHVVIGWQRQIREQQRGRHDNQ